MIITHFTLPLSQQYKTMNIMKYCIFPDFTITDCYVMGFAFVGRVGQSR